MGMDALLKLVKELGAIRNVPQFLFSESIWYSTSLAVRKAIAEHRKKSPGDTEIDFILQSSGGMPGDGYRIIRALRTSFKTVNIVVPFWAKSAATLVSLGASKLIVNDWADFGPIDIQVPKPKEDSPEFDYESALNDESSLELIEGRAQELYKKMFIDFHRSKHIPISRNALSSDLIEYLPKFYQPLLTQLSPYKLGEKKRQLEISTKYANRILVQYNSLNEEQRLSLIDYLVHDCPEHGYVIDYPVLSLFLPNIVMATKIGVDYAAKLDELSLFLMEAKADEKYIGFVYGLKPAASAAAAPAAGATTVTSKTIVGGEDSDGQKEAPAAKPVAPEKAKAYAT
jgi:hypothetical protein